MDEVQNTKFIVRMHAQQKAYDTSKDQICALGYDVLFAIAQEIEPELNEVEFKAYILAKVVARELLAYHKEGNVQCIGSQGPYYRLT